MTLSELKVVLPPLCIWMAKTAIKEGVQAYHKSHKQRDIQKQKEEAGEPYDYTVVHAYKEGVNIAAEVLCKVFASCSAECQQAIEVVAQERDGFFGCSESYFDDFVKALEKVQGHAVRLRVAE